MTSETEAAAKFAAYIETRMLGPLAGEVAVRRYVDSQNRFNEYMARVRAELPNRLPLRMLPRQHLMQFCRRVYRLWRVTPRDILLPVLASEGTRWVNEWASSEQVAMAARVALESLDARFAEAELAALAGMIAGHVEERRKRRVASGAQAAASEREGGLTERLHRVRTARRRAQ